MLDSVFLTSQALVMVLEPSDLQAAVRREADSLEWLPLALKGRSVMHSLGFAPELHDITPCLSTLKKTL